LGPYVTLVQQKGQRTFARRIPEKSQCHAIFGCERAEGSDGRLKRAEHEREARRARASRSKELIAEGRIPIALARDHTCDAGSGRSLQSERMFDRFVENLRETPACRRADPLELNDYHPGFAESAARRVPLLGRREASLAGDCAVSEPEPLAVVHRAGQVNPFIHGRAGDVGTLSRNWPSFWRAAESSGRVDR